LYLFWGMLMCYPNLALVVLRGGRLGGVLGGLSVLCIEDRLYLFIPRVSGIYPMIQVGLFCDAAGSPISLFSGASTDCFSVPSLCCLSRSSRLRDMISLKGQSSERGERMRATKFGARWAIRETVAECIFEPLEWCTSSGQPL
jgi:hypothetical protein